jgi:serine/threonine protein kinase
MSRRNPNALKRFVFLKNRYLVGEILGSGGFGITYKVFDTETNSYKAVKEYFPSCFSAYRTGESKSVSISSNFGNQYKKGLESFYKEAQVLYGLKGIRSVVKVEDFFMENGTAYIVMEYVDGVSLNSICKASGGTVQFDEMMKQFIELALTLDEVHMCGIAHRDVSPGNIMILPDGSVKLIDFGAARYVDKSNKLFR